VTVGWTLDLMRRLPDAPPGVMEFLIATAAVDVRADGAALLSLSGAPLARTATDGDGLQRLLDVFARRLEPVYGFGSLLAFKAKFQPLYRPLYLAYADPVALPAIGNALARAYLPELTPRVLTRLARAVLT
jgi:phosphatidylglycerol lysyltransferase